MGKWRPNTDFMPLSRTLRTLQNRVDFIISSLAGIPASPPPPPPLASPRGSIVNSNWCRWGIVNSNWCRGGRRGGRRGGGGRKGSVQKGLKKSRTGGIKLPMPLCCKCGCGIIKSTLENHEMGPFLGFKMVPCTKSRLLEGPSTFLAPKWPSLSLRPFKGCQKSLGPL